MTNPFLEATENALGDLLRERGFVVLDHAYDAEHFGNAHVTYRSPRLLIRLTRDRGMVFLSIGQKRRSLYDLAQLVAFLDPQSGWSYKLPDETSTVYSSTEWRLAEIRRVFEKYGTQLLDSSLYTKQRRELAYFIYTESRKEKPFARKCQ